MLVNSRPKIITLGVLGAVMALLIVGLMYSQRTVQADDGMINVPAGAQIIPTGLAPTFECKWELRDALPFDDVSGGYMPDPAMQYASAAGAHDHDDAMAVVPVPGGWACIGPETGNLPSMPDQVMNMIQVMPMPHLSPLDEVPRRDIQLWVAVDHPNGIGNIDDVYWDIFHPDGTLKIQVHGTKIGDKDADKPSPGQVGGGAGQPGGYSLPGWDLDNDDAFGSAGLGASQRRIKECGLLGQHDTAGSMFEAAYHTGQVSAAAIDDIDKGIVAKCQENEKAVYYAKFDVVKDQPCGKYRIEAHAVANANEADVLTNYIDILCFWYLNTDFSGLSWGDITPGNMQMISGDLIWDDGGVATPSNNGPTVHNGGNHPMGIRIHFSEMLQQDVASPKKIDKFDACFGKGPGFGILECVGQSDELDAFGIPIDAIMASEVTGFGPDPGSPSASNGWHGDFDQVLCANDVGKLDLSIHPYKLLPQGTYLGDFELWAHTVHTLPNGPFCEGDQEQHIS